MTQIDEVLHLKSLYQQCENRGWSEVSHKDKNDFLTVQSSDTNFTHVPKLFTRLPDCCLVSPFLSHKNLKILNVIESEFDSSRLVSITSTKKYLQFYIYGYNGNIIRHSKIKKYTCCIPTALREWLRTLLKEQRNANKF